MGIQHVAAFVLSNRGWRERAYNASAFMPPVPIFDKVWWVNFIFIVEHIPYLPCIGMAFNWYLVSQLTMAGILFLLLYILLVVVLYWKLSAPYSAGLHGWTVSASNPMELHRNSEPYPAVPSRVAGALFSAKNHGYKTVSASDEVKGQDG
jgi:hypothetical protein